MMKALKFLSFVAILALLPAVSYADPAKKERKPHYRVEEPRPVVGPLNDTRGNAALGGNNANSAFGDNSAGSNANGRTSGGAGGMN
ncbi:hypothetical protein [Tardiphaga sp. 813_E8_N1_3]|uniref:hypothetical protein n=1 Tax=Tardiphaga sp. 813_E8_N1_3 TaxID=3240760 RepID=UPI003F220CD7